MNSQTAQTERSAKFSIFSLIAVVCAFLSFTTGALLGFILAGVAIAAGLIGVLLSFSSKTRGGIVSIISVLAGMVGIIAAIIKLLRVAV